MKLLLSFLLLPFVLFAYTPVITPNGGILPYVMDGEVKVFHLTAELVEQEFSPGLKVNCWGYNGRTPGPTIEAVEGDRVRIYVTNHLPEATTVHWHGILLPNGMDGVAGVTQRPIEPGETFKYEFELKQYGTYMYHPHFDSVVEIGLGLVGMFIIHPKIPEDPQIDRDFVIMLQEWSIPTGASTPNPITMDFNYFTFNGKVFPGADPLLVKQNEHVRVRFGNLSMDSHPIHLHGYVFTVTSHGGPPLPKSAQYPGYTVNVAVGNTNDFEFVADNPGDWVMHCHKTHHNMSGMVHDLPNLVGVDMKGVSNKIKKVIPGFMPMGDKGMTMEPEMAKMPGPANFLPPIGGPGQFGYVDMSGMFTIVKVRENLKEGEDPGWYEQPPGTSAEPITLQKKKK